MHISTGSHLFRDLRCSLTSMKTSRWLVSEKYTVKNVWQILNWRSLALLCHGHDDESQLCNVFQGEKLKSPLTWTYPTPEQWSKKHWKQRWWLLLIFPEDVNLMGYVKPKNTEVSTERWMPRWKLFTSGPTDHRVTTTLLISLRLSSTTKTSNTFDHFSRWCQASGMSTMTRICGRIRDVSTRNDIWTKMGGSWNRTKWFHFPLDQGVAWEKILPGLKFSSLSSAFFKSSSFFPTTTSLNRAWK